MQRAYIDALAQLAQSDENVVSVVADNGTDYDWLFQRDFPDQFYNVGIAEQNMVAMAAGLSDMGLIPFISTAGAFLLYRAYEFIRNDICLGHKNVKMVATGSGVSISNLGPTHHTTEDIALLRTLPGLTVFSPSTPEEVRIAVQEAYQTDGPVYIRLGMTGEHNFAAPSDSLFVANCLLEGTDVAICCTGSIGQTVLCAAEALQKSGLSAGVYAFPCLNPLDCDTVNRISQQARLLVTVEDHNQDCGVGGLIASVLAGKASHAPLLTIGTNGFAVGYGQQDQVRNQNSLSADAIAHRIQEKWEAIV